MQGQIVFESVDSRSCNVAEECGADLAKAATLLLGGGEGGEKEAVAVLTVTPPPPQPRRHANTT